MNGILRIAAAWAVLALVVGGAGIVCPACAQALDAEGMSFEAFTDLADGSGNEVAQVPALAEEADYRQVACPRQGFTTACEAGLCWSWDDVNGLIIHTGQGCGAPCLMIRVTGSGGTDFAGYFDDILTPLVRSALGDRLLSVSPLDAYALGDATLPGVMYVFLDGEGRRQTLFRLFDTRWPLNVCYTLRYDEANADDMLRALGVAVAHFRPVGALTEGMPEEDADFMEPPCRIDCPQQGFTAVCDVACATHWDPNDGLYVFLGEWGRPPYVLMRVAGETDIPAFFRDAVTPFMAGRYGDDLLEVIDCGNITIGRRVMTGFGYRYRAGDQDTVYMLRVLENRDGCNLSCIMKYPEGDGTAREKGMAALASLVDSFRRN